MLKPSGEMRYMRNGHRCRVHIGDFRVYARLHYPSEEDAAVITENYLKEVETRKALERDRSLQKKKTGK
jgi:hypothetical protein